MCLFPMASPARPETSASPPARPLWRRAWRRWRRPCGYLLAGAGFTVAALLVLQQLLGRRLEQLQIRQLGSELAAGVVLGEVALERFSPQVLSEISGLRLAVGTDPAGRAAADRPLQRQTLLLRQQICRRLSHCPRVRPAPPGPGGPRGVWVELASPLEAVWLFAPMPSRWGWPPDPGLLSLSLAAGGLGAVLLFLTLEVQRPLAQLEQALAEVGLEQRPAALPGRGARSVRQITARFNAMLERLEQASRERTTMLAGIAHDLRAPLTRLRLRLDLAATAGGLDPAERRRGQADLNALERITNQFLLFAGAEQAEPAVLVPLQGLVAEVAAMVGPEPPQLELAPLERWVRPTALARALANLIENAGVHGAPPLRLVLRAGEADPAAFVIEVWDRGGGIPASAWATALEPFQRLDSARGGEGHCGLGLAIAERIARQHGGGLRRLEGPGGFGVALEGRSLAAGEPPAAALPRPVTSGHSPGPPRSQS